MMYKYLLLAMFLISLNAAFTAGRYVESHYSVRKLAIENNCGEYDRTTGEFKWVKNVSEEDIKKSLYDDEVSKEKLIKDLKKHTK